MLGTRLWQVCNVVRSGELGWGGLVPSGLLFGRRCMIMRDTVLLVRPCHDVPQSATGSSVDPGLERALKELADVILAKVGPCLVLGWCPVGGDGDSLRMTCFYWGSCWTL